MSADRVWPLEMARSGEWCEIAEIAGDAQWIGRMADLGLRVGSCLQVLQPGVPCLLQIDGSRLCLRGDDVLRILVRPLATEP